MDAALIGFRHRPAWLMGVLGLLAVQGWATLTFFGAVDTRSALFGEEPVVSGRHPLHFYHAQLGSESRRPDRDACCYDPDFQAGYPKTPLFDGGCRAAELALTIFPGGSPAAVYKLALAGSCLMIPMLMILAGRGFGLSPGASCLAGAMAALIGWAEPARVLIIAGDHRGMLAGLCALAHLGWQVRFSRWPGLDSWVTLAVTAAAGWFLHPVGWCATAVVAVGCYLWVAWKQELTWHLSWLAAGTVGLAVNGFWLWDWVRSVWIHPPVDVDAVATWSAGGEIPEVVTSTGLVVAALFAVCPAAALIRRSGRLALAVSILASVVGLLYTAPRGERITVGLDEPERSLVRVLRAETAVDSRILWEEPGPGDPPEGWTALLPRLTGRAFLGGIDPEADFDHQFARLRDGRLAGVPIDAWEDAELDRFIRRYNVGWVVCRTEESASRFRRLPGSREISSPVPVTKRWLFALEGAVGFVLSGEGEVDVADHRRIGLSEVVPTADGEVVLSFHYQPGMTVEPRYVTIEPEKDTLKRLDPVPFIRLRIPGQVPRLVITWDRP